MQQPIEQPDPQQEEIELIYAGLSDEELMDLIRINVAQMLRARHILKARQKLHE